MLPVQTNRLLIYPCRLPLLTEIYLRHPHAADKLSATLPDNWPQQELREMLPHFIELLQHDPRSFPWLMWIIVNKEMKMVIGEVGFKGRPDENGVIEIGYSLLPQYQRNGYMKEAATALVQWAFGQPEVKKLVAESHLSNIGSIKVLTALGMKATGIDGEMQYWELINRRTNLPGSVAQT
ncbi:Protein N-acetyltransferase, RimJ/RimL family [Chitinophaga terrae (ex Kim and Jung 2007)]|jgi:ribosomal-protein-alanine N-acetyltransferase|uniref:Protein N-acetyltransferase, RimJ/RimL family n=1 Tax=Chitinophaga terrae (ex Kim and Jung 2007) TaxID=408074 RepID=A0A1H4G7B4_9BACT|nr:Protein N-acetyltransferase, RimJ/RimL family [Chitinophaga terrae (ex Kim and Jung 2007)]